MEEIPRSSVEDVTSGLSAKQSATSRHSSFWAYTNIQKDGNPLIDNKGASNMACPKARRKVGVRDEVTETSHVDVDTLRIHSTEKDPVIDPASLDS
ncbi:hypothetical protein DH2020_029084 [Rehmannia glutinosa]|uniref:Uncharacterized protein n=1 Tax=Rehmannia glutinosa TaxID=99300 RepID=A0ABR0VSB5_REHGL